MLLKKLNLMIIVRPDQKLILDKRSDCKQDRILPKVGNWTCRKIMNELLRIFEFTISKNAKGHVIGD